MLLTIMVPVLLESRIGSIRAERIISAAETITLEIDRALVESIYGAASTNLPEDTRFACNIIRSPFDLDDVMEGWVDSEVEKIDIKREITRWEFTSDERPSFKVEIFTRPFPE